MSGIANLQPTCGKCRHRHLPGLRCWAGDWTRALRIAVFTNMGTTCHLCGGAGADTLDHLVSRALGGTDDLANLAPAHRFCNTGRGAAPLTPPTPLDTSRW